MVIKWEKKEAEIKAMKKMFILVLDKSGSMTSDFDKLKDDALKLGEKIEESSFTDFYCITYSSQVTCYKHKTGDLSGYKSFI